MWAGSGHSSQREPIGNEAKERFSSRKEGCVGPQARGLVSVSAKNKGLVEIKFSPIEK